AQERQVEDSVMRRAIVPRDASPVQYERHRQLMQADVHHHLVEGALQEGRIDDHDRTQARHGKAGRKGHRVLFRDPDVVEPVGKAFGEGAQPGAAAHRRGDRNQARLSLGLAQQCLAEDVRKRYFAAQWFRRQHVEGTDAVKMVDFIGFGRPVATTFGRDHVDQRWFTEAADLSQRALDILDVVAVDRARILDAEVLAEGTRRDEFLQAFLDAAYGFDGFVTG